MSAMQEPTDRKETRRLHCALTQEEFNIRATEHVGVLRGIEILEGKAKRVAEQFKERMAGERAKARTLRLAVQDRRELRDISCTWHSDWASKSMLLRRDDDGTVVEARTMTADEVQRGFDFDGPGRTTRKDRQLPPKRDESDDAEPEDGETLDG